ncbi:NAD-dependent epimerase/dehydratase family protein [Candidatus Sumerlaeota bacterium]|nr:NAD-dependent epimerase/dehydratase family protein [Candidatus Sumerlaeota bacterium]
MKNLITGAAGFIGSSIARRLIAQGQTVRGIDCFIDYYPRSIKENNIAPLRDCAEFEFIEDSLMSVDLERLLDGVKVVYHQAAQAGVRASWGRDFEIYTENNIRATQRLLEACRDRTIKVVYASSSSVYGDTEDLPMRETSPTAPHSPYGVSKLAAEHLCRLYTRNFGLHTVSLRYFTVYGPGQRPDMAFHKWIRAALTGNPVTVYGDGAQTRDFTFIDDIVTANLLAAERGQPGAVYNLGGGNRIDVNGVLELLGGILGDALKVERIEKQKGDVRHTFADTTLAQQDLGFKPAITLEEGLCKEAEWIEQVILPLAV